MLACINVYVAVCSYLRVGLSVYLYMRLPVGVWGMVWVGHQGPALNAKSATWSQIGPQPGFISPPSFGNEWD